MSYGLELVHIWHIGHLNMDPIHKELCHKDHIVKNETSLYTFFLPFLYKLVKYFFFFGKQLDFDWEGIHRFFNLFQRCHPRQKSYRWSPFPVQPWWSSRSRIPWVAFPSLSTERNGVWPDRIGLERTITLRKVSHISPTIVQLNFRNIQ